MTRRKQLVGSLPSSSRWQHGVVVKPMDFGIRFFWTQILALPLTSCFTLGELFNLNFPVYNKMGGGDKYPSHGVVTRPFTKSLEYNWHFIV